MPACALVRVVQGPQPKGVMMHDVGIRRVRRGAQTGRGAKTRRPVAPEDCRAQGAGRLWLAVPRRFQVRGEQIHLPPRGGQRCTQGANGFAGAPVLYFDARDDVTEFQMDDRTTDQGLLSTDYRLLITASYR